MQVNAGLNIKIGEMRNDSHLKGAIIAVVLYRIYAYGNLSDDSVTLRSENSVSIRE